MAVVIYILLFALEVSLYFKLHVLVNSVVLKYIIKNQVLMILRYTHGRYAGAVFLYIAYCIMHIHIECHMV